MNNSKRQLLKRRAIHKIKARKSWHSLKGDFVNEVVDILKAGAKMRGFEIIDAQADESTFKVTIGENFSPTDTPPFENITHFMAAIFGESFTEPEFDEDDKLTGKYIHRLLPKRDEDKVLDSEFVQ